MRNVEHKSTYRQVLHPTCLNGVNKSNFCINCRFKLETTELTRILQTQALRVGQVKEPCIGLMQENSIENSVQDCLPYIQILTGPCKLFLAYPKWPCVCLKVNMHSPYCMTSLFQNFLLPSMYHVTCDHVIWCDLLCDSMILSL